MKKLIIAVVVSAAAASSALAETVKVAGSGGMIPLITSIAKSYTAKHKGENIDVNQKSLGKEGGIMSLNKGAIDIAMLSTVNSKDKKLPFDFHPVAIVPSIFVVNSSANVKSLSSQQVCAIYSGKITNWKEVGGTDAPIVVLTRPENESAKIAIKEGLQCFKTLREIPTAVNLAKAVDMSNSLVKIKYSIGITNTVMYDEIKGRVTAPKFDGIDINNLNPSKWSMKTTSYLAASKKPSVSTLKFIEYVKSAEAKKIIRKEKGIPVE